MENSKIYARDWTAVLFRDSVIITTQGMKTIKKWIPFGKSKPRVSVLRLDGLIAPGGRVAGGALNDATIATIAERAFKNKKFREVALLINSPGGSPVQSSLIASRIRRLSDESGLKVTAFVEDVAASGGYWLATSADEIFADRSSILGSIGVVSASFGFHEMIGKLGIERRLYTAGRHKSFLDPFEPEKTSDVRRLKSLHKTLHATFIQHVKECRGDRLDDSTDVFNGDFWLAEKAVELGLADGIGHLVPFMKERYGEDVKFSVFGRRRPWLSRIGAGIIEGVAVEIEEQAIRSQYGIR